MDKIYSLAENEKEMGLDGQGVSSFYSEGMTRAEIQVVQDWMTANKIEGYNTRLFKVADKGTTRSDNSLRTLPKIVILAICSVRIAFGKRRS